MYDEAKALLTEWMKKNPADDNAQGLLDELSKIESS